MSGRRALSPQEERQLLKAIRGFSPRDRALVTCQWLTGFRISECLSLKVGAVLRGDQLTSKIGIPPRNLKGGYGATRWVPVVPELARALEKHLAWLRRRYVLTGDLPLFLSRENNADGTARALSREAARQIIHRAFALAGIENDGRLGSHSLRKTFARNVYRNAGNDLMILRAALGHSDVSITQRYLEPDEGSVFAAISRCDFSRSRKHLSREIS